MSTIKTKILPIVLAVAMLLSMVVVASAAPGQNARITGMAEPIVIGFSGSTSLGDIAPQDRVVLHIDLTDTMFTWNDHTPNPRDPAAIPSSVLRRDRVDARVTGNTNIIERVSVNAAHSRIEVEFVRTLVGTRGVDFVFYVIPVIGGRQHRDYAVTFDGTFANPEFGVWDNTDREDISDGSIAYAQETIREITFEVGAGMTITTRMQSGSRMFAVATFEPDNRDLTVFNDHPSIREVINLRHSGFPNSAIVRLDSIFGNYFVYGANGNFLGRGNEDLPLGNKFYLSTSRLEVTTPTDNQETPDGPADELAPPTDGDAVAQQPAPGTNVNHNPPTGR